MSNTIIVKYTSEYDNELLNYSFEDTSDAKEWLNENTGYFENGDKVCIIDFRNNKSEILVIRLKLEFENV